MIKHRGEGDKSEVGIWLLCDMAAVLELEARGTMVRSSLICLKGQFVTTLTS
jgi:hypothetical protein